MSNVQFQHLAKLIASSGNVLPSAAMEAIKADCRSKLVRLGADHGDWLVVGLSGDIFICPYRPSLEACFYSWSRRDDCGLAEFMYTLPPEMLEALRLETYWRDYLLEL